MIKMAGGNAILRGGDFTSTRPNMVSDNRIFTALIREIGS